MSLYNQLRMMIRIRLFEERVIKLKSEKMISGPIHTYIGQEAIAAGVCLALSDSDYIIGNHRSHGHLIAKGTDIKVLMAEIFRCNGASMHVNDRSVGAICSTAIVGSGLPLACGVAFASKYKKDNNVTCVFFGDGAVNEGVFYESINLASAWNLPVLFVIENNSIAVTTSMHEDLIYRTTPFDIDRQQVYGQDVDEVFNATKRAIDIIHNSKPAIIECKTMRFREHQEGAAYEKVKESGYRDNNEVNYWIEHRDPIKLYSEKLIRDKIIEQSEIDKIYLEETERINEAVEFAITSPMSHNAYNNMLT